MLQELMAENFPKQISRYLVGSSTRICLSKVYYYFFILFLCVWGIYLFHLEQVELLINLFIYFCFLGPHPRHMEVPGLGVQLELQLLTYTTTTARRDPSHFYNLCCSLSQCWIFNPLNEARD